MTFPQKTHQVIIHIHLHLLFNIELFAKIPTTLIFSSIAWTPLGQELDDSPLGFVIGGHPDGTVSLWNIYTIITGGTQDPKKNLGMIKFKLICHNPISVISVNFKPNLFAIGAGSVSILSINPSSNYDIKVEVSCEPPKEGGDFVSLNWNEKVTHILASSTNTGMTYIYDMKRCAIFLSILDQTFLGEGEQPSLPMNTCVLWGSDGAQVIIAYDHPGFNYLTQYHMKQPKAASAMYQNGHTSSIIDIIKNPNDTNFMLSLGRDGVVTCWSIKTKKPIYKVVLPHKATQIFWLNKIPDVFIYVGCDGTLYQDRINFTEDLSLYNEGIEVIPKWLTKQASVSFGFGGKVFKFSNKNPSTIEVFKLGGNKQLIETIRGFLAKIEKNDLNEIFNEKIQNTEKDKNVNISLFWAALKAAYTKNIDELFKQMGFDVNTMSDEVGAALGRSKKKDNKIRELYQPQMEEEDLGKLFEKPIPQNEPVQNAQTKQELLETPNTVQETFTRNINWNVGNEKLIKQALLIGELDNAVDLLFKSNRYSEALLIASCKPELFEKAKETYFNSNNDLFVQSIFPAIINNNFDSLFDFNIIKEWKEYLIYSKSYSAEFQQFAKKLGDKLSQHITQDIYACLICYILAQEYEKCINVLYAYYEKELEKVTARQDRKFMLQNLFEQMVCVNNVLNVNGMYVNANYNKVIYDYCLLLIEEGLNIEASKYLVNIKDSDIKINELYERLYYNCEYELSKIFAKPANPYNIIPIKAKLPQQQQHQQYHQQQQPQTRPIYNQQQHHPPSTSSSNIKPPFKPHQPPIPNTAVPEVKRHGIVHTPSHPPFNKPLQPSMQQQPQQTHLDQSQPHQQQLHPPNFPMQNQPQQPPITKPTVDFGKGMQAIRKPPQLRTNPPPIRQIPQPKLPLQQQQQQPQQQYAMPQHNEPQKQWVNPQQEKATPFQPHQQPHVPKGNDIQQSKPAELTKDEQKIHDFFERMIGVYNAAYSDENKQRDFLTKIKELFTKLEKHEIKPNLMKHLFDFMDLFEQKKSTKSMYYKIQACDWDNNKSWMPLIDKLNNIKH